MQEVEITKEMIEAGMIALLQCSYSDLECKSAKLLEEYEDEVVRVFKAMMREMAK